MAFDETVKIRICIEISTEEEADTRLSVAEWNDLTDEQRRKIYQQMWDEAAGNADGGGISVVTPGAQWI